MDPKTQSFRQTVNPTRPSLNRYRHATPTYEAVDPFKPSIAFSLRQLAPKSSLQEDINVLEDDRPPGPIRMTGLTRQPPAVSTNSPSKWGHRPMFYEAVIPPIFPSDQPPAGRNVHRPHGAAEYQSSVLPQGSFSENFPPCIPLGSPVSQVSGQPPRNTTPYHFMANNDTSHSQSDRTGRSHSPSRSSERLSPPSPPLEQLTPNPSLSLRSSISASPSPPPILSHHHLPRPATPHLRIHQSVPRVDSNLSLKTDFLDENQLTQSVTLEFPANSYVVAFLFDALPRQIYLNLLLRLPYLYFSRVIRIFEEAEMSMPMIRQGILDAARANAETTGFAGILGQPLSGRSKGWGVQLEPANDNAAYNNLQTTWLAFIDSLLQEWKTLNIISVLLLSAILTILQIQSAASDPFTRSSALLSMICALMSLVYGCIYIIRFATMKKTYKGAAWAQEAQKSESGIWWNIWVMLAMPATWLAWSLILFIVTITAFVWRSSPFQSGTSSDFAPFWTSPQIIIPRILITTVLSLGILYFILIAFTLRRYGTMMDRAWQKRIWGWMESADDGSDIDVEANRYPATSWYGGNIIITQDIVDEAPPWSTYGYPTASCHCDGDVTQSPNIPPWPTYSPVQTQMLSNIPDRYGDQIRDDRYSPKIISHPPLTSLILDPVGSGDITLSPLHELRNVLSPIAEEPYLTFPTQDQTAKINEMLHALVSPSPHSVEGSNFLKLCELPLCGDCLDIKPSADDLNKCGFNLDAFNFRSSDGWEQFKEHVQSVFEAPFHDPFAQAASNSVPETVHDALWRVMELWTAKLQFNGVTGFLASCEPRPGDLAVAIYYFNENRDHSDGPPHSSPISV